MRDHIKILGILNIVMGSLTALGGLVVMLFLGGMASILAMGVGDASDAENARVAAPLVGLFGGAITIFLLAWGALTILGGWGLLKYKPWSRILMIILSGISLIHFPIGTALGIYGLWVLLNDQSRQLLESGGTMPPQIYPMQQQPATGYPGPQPPQGV
jgi:hypothetical protein